MLLCIDRGVSFKAIDRFDMNFKGDGEPGDDPRAPYYRQHQFATQIERLLAKERITRVFDLDLSLNPQRLQAAPAKAIGLTR
jgi:hypothetical protein